MYRYIYICYRNEIKLPIKNIHTTREHQYRVNAERRSNEQAKSRVKILVKLIVKRPVENRVGWQGSSATYLKYKAGFIAVDLLLSRQTLFSPPCYLYLP